MSVLVTATLLMVGVHTIGMVPTVLVDLGWSLESKEIRYCDHLRGLEASTLRRAALTLRVSYLKWQLETGA
jgi:hypothetical protein